MACFLCRRFCTGWKMTLTSKKNLCYIRESRSHRNTMKMKININMKMKMKNLMMRNMTVRIWLMTRNRKTILRQKERTIYRAVYRLAVREILILCIYCCQVQTRGGLCMWKANWHTFSFQGNRAFLHGTKDGCVKSAADIIFFGLEQI